MSLTRLIILPWRHGEAAWYRVTDENGVLERGPIAAAPAPHADLRTVLVVPGVEVLCRWLSLPRGQDAQVAAAAALMLEDELAGSREDLHVALGAPEPDGTRLVVVADRVRMQAWLDDAAALGVRPSAVCPDHLLLPDPDPEGDEALAVVVDETALVRGQGLALSCDAELLPLIMAGRPYRLVEAGPETERLTSARAARPPIDLQQGAFSRADAGRSRVRPARAPILAALLLASLVALPVVQAGRAELAIHRAAQRIGTLAGEPRAGSAGKALTRLRAQSARIRAAEAFPLRAAALFAAIEGVEGMQVQTLLYGQDGVLRATLDHVNYSDVELLRRALARSGLTVEEKSAVVDQGRVLSDVAVRARS